MFNRIQLLAILAGASGGAIAIGSMETFSATTAFPLVQPSENEGLIFA
jgi:hypothetical protein